MNMEEEKSPSEVFEDNLSAIKKQIYARLCALYAGLDQEIQRCREENDVAGMGRAYVWFREMWKEDADSVDDGMKLVNQRYTKMQEVDIPDILEKNGMPNVPLSDVGRTVSLSIRTKASIRTGQKEAAIAWFQADRDAVEALSVGDYDAALDALERGGRRDLAKKLTDPTGQVDTGALIKTIEETTQHLEGIVVPHVNPQTLSSIAKNMAERGEELPEELFNTYLQTTTTWRKNASK